MLKPYTTRMAKIQGPKEGKTYSNIYRMKLWTCSFYHFISHVESLVHSLEFWAALF